MTMKTAILTAGCFAVLLFLTACKRDASLGEAGPASPTVVQTGDMSLVSVDKPDLFPLVTADAHQAKSELKVTGTVMPDISREIPVISLANGRVVDIKARLDDHVKKGDLLMKVQSPDIANVFDVYLKAVSDERLASKALTRAQTLLDHGAISQAMLEQAEDAETDAKADLTAAEQNLKVMGVNKDNPSETVNVYAPVSGVIIAQNVTQAAAAGVTLSGNATAFTIADLSNVWVICDVFENDISRIALGQSAEIRLNAYPDKPLVGHVSDIGPVLDPSIRTAKVRIELSNPGNLKLGMFATATFSGNSNEVHAAVPAAAVLHLHDRDWVFVPAADNKFRRVEVKAGNTLADNMQEILSGISAGQRVVSNVLQLEATLEAQ